MDKKAALLAMLSGKLVRNTLWVFPVFWDGGKFKCTDHLKDHEAMPDVATWPEFGYYIEKKRSKMAPMLYKDPEGTVSVSGSMYASEISAKVDIDSGETFIRWLIDTPYALEIDVE